jgi:bifunctional enzyme CysN/CysC
VTQTEERPDTFRAETPLTVSSSLPENIVPFDYARDRSQRSSQKGHEPRVVWLTGLPGSGKSTLANHVDTQLAQLGIHSYVLDGDSLRAGLSADLGFTPEDRRENVRRVAEVAHLMYDAGLVVIVALVSPFGADRDLARSLFPEGDFLEVHVDTPVEICAERDPKGLYAKAAAGNLATMTGRGQRYEAPLQPDLVVHGVGEVSANAAAVVEAALAGTTPAAR